MYLKEKKRKEMKMSGNVKNYCDVELYNNWK